MSWYAPYFQGIFWGENETDGYSMYELHAAEIQELKTHPNGLNSCSPSKIMKSSKIVVLQITFTFRRKRAKQLDISEEFNAVKDI